MTKIYAIDFEYFNSQEPTLSLVCAAVSCAEYDKTYWLYDEVDKHRLIHLLNTIKESQGVLLAYSAGAEARSLISLGFNPMDFKWIDQKLEYAMLINHHPTFSYGKHYFKSGGIKFITESKEKRYMTQEQQKRHNFNKPETNLLACTYKLTGETRTSEYKEKMRDYILTKDRAIHEEHREDILKYCLEDAQILRELLKKTLAEYDRLNRVLGCDVTMEEILYRGSIGALSGKIENNGYPVSIDEINNFTENCPLMIRHLQNDINRQFDFPFFKVAKNKYTMNRKMLQHIASTDYAHLPWGRSKETGAISFDEESLKKVCSKKQDFTRGHVVEQLVRFNTFKKSLAGFLPGKDSRKITDDLGSDSRIRCWINPYGSQTSRFQPPSTSFVPLKSRWVRSMIKPAKGKVILAVDYASEEFLLSAILSGCKNMYDAYCSGDVYLHTAKLCGAVPQDGTKANYGAERTLFKTIVLGLSYLMSKYGLSHRLTDALGRTVGTEEAQDYIDTFYKPYREYKEYMENLWYDYLSRNFLKLKDGWIMWGANDNHRSTTNAPTQGSGAVVLRRALLKADSLGYKILFPLHDAAYFEVDNDIDTVRKALSELNQVMLDAVVESFDTPVQKEWAKAMRVEWDIWGDCEHLENEDLGMPVHNYGKIYLPEGSEKDYDFFKKFFSKLEKDEKIYIA